MTNPISVEQQNFIPNEEKNIFIHFLIFNALLVLATAILPFLYTTEITFYRFIFSGISVLLGGILLTITFKTKKNPKQILSTLQMIMIGMIVCIIMASLAIQLAICQNDHLFIILFFHFNLVYFIAAWRRLLWFAMAIFIAVFLISHFILNHHNYYQQAEIIILVIVATYLSTKVYSIILNGYKHVNALIQQKEKLTALLEQRQTHNKHAIEHINELRDKLSRAKLETQSAMTAKTEFLATVSHEIRTPLNGLLPILEFLRDTDLDDEQLQYLKTAYISSQQLLRIINDILDFSKVDVGKLELENIEVNLKQLIENVVDLMSGNAQRRGITLEYFIGSDIPAFVRGDPVRLRQILTNLIGNSIKFTEKGGVTVEITRRRELKTEIDLLFSIKDTGAGMTPKTASGLFKSFSQADASTTRTHGGTGLGLAICKRLVELMGGHIGVRSKLDQGSVFWFSLPLRKSIRDMPAKRISLSSTRVLILTMNDMEAEKVSDLLNTWDMFTQIETNPDKAFNQLKSSVILGQGWTFDLLLILVNDNEKESIQLIDSILKINNLGDLQILLIAEQGKSFEKYNNNARINEIKRPYTEGQTKTTLIRILDVADDCITESDESRERNLINADGLVDDWADLAAGKEKIKRQHFKGKVLVVEDNPVNLNVSRKLLTKLGLSCDIAEDGKQGLAKIAENKYDLVFMDCQMPIMDGYTATGMIRKAESEKGDGFRLPIIAMTANAMAGDRRKCINAGMDDYLSKPVNKRNLLLTLGEWIKETATDEEGKPVVQKNKLVTDNFSELADKAILTENCDRLLDYEILEELREVMEEEFTDIILVYMDSAPQLLKKIKEATDSGDIKGLISPAHSLKSSSANVGAMRVSGVAKKLEHAARKSDFDVAAISSKHLQKIFPETYDKLTELITSFKF